MALKLEQKKKIVDEVAIAAGSALSIVAADYRGLTAAQMTLLREKARNSGVKLHIVRNTLACRAFAGTNYECLNETLVGPVLLAFSDTEPGASARLLRDFAKENDKLEVKSLSLGKGLIDKSQLQVVANLPTKDEAIARLARVLQAPITKFVRTLAEPHSKLVRIFAAIRDKK